MRQPPARHDPAELIAELKASIAGIKRIVAGIRRIHPELMTAQDWRQMRTCYLSALETQVSLLRTQIALLERDVRDERSHSQSNRRT